VFRGPLSPTSFFRSTSEDLSRKKCRGAGCWIGSGCKGLGFQGASPLSDFGFCISSINIDDPVKSHKSRRSRGVREPRTAWFNWIPAFAGMTKFKEFRLFTNHQHSAIDNPQFQVARRSMKKRVLMIFGPQILILCLVTHPGKGHFQRVPRIRSATFSVLGRRRPDPGADGLGLHREFRPFSFQIGGGLVHAVSPRAEVVQTR